MFHSNQKICFRVHSDKNLERLEVVFNENKSTESQFLGV